jgi:hypothetical protein
VCGIDSCTAPWADCDGDAANGCETNTATSAQNCGGCNAQCNSQNGTATCAAAACGIVCNPGYADCDGELSNGCEIAMQTDVSNCGTCVGNVCC